MLSYLHTGNYQVSCSSDLWGSFNIDQGNSAADHLLSARVCHYDAFMHQHMSCIIYDTLL